MNWGSLPLIFLGGLGGFAIRQAAGLAIPLGFLKFSRGAEEEADQLAAQYLWASGYDPHSLVTFFEKLEVTEKKPGTIASLFRDHPVAGDRAEKVNALVARFPDRSEYTINTSEFNQVKGRLVSLTNARTSASSRNGASAEREAQRTTLRRRQPAPPDGTDPDAGQTPAGDQEQKTTPERPTLRRRSDTGAEVIDRFTQVLDTAHHRTQLTIYLRLLDKVVPATYGPTADVTWIGADPTNTVEAADRG